MATPLPSTRTPRRGRARRALHPFAAGFRPAATALAVALACGWTATPSWAQPVPAQVNHGSASFARAGANLTVTTTNGLGTNHSAIDWKSFSVPAGSVTRFVQPSDTSLSINRVVAPAPSEILGRLASNGRLVLVNPWGIAVAPGAQVDTAGFTASTLAMSPQDAAAGRLRFDGGGAPLKMEGTIRARGGDVVLIAPDIATGAQAVIESDGAAVLAAGRSVEITGRGLEGIHLQVQARSQARNLGSLQGDAVGIFAGTLRHSGLVQAQSAEVDGGRVVLQASRAARVDGTIRARAGDRGGSVDVFGDRVGLLAHARIDASGAAGGGSVRVGGGLQGGDAQAPNAERTYVDARATIHADATGAGDGGRVIVWADDTTRMRGQISARGGPRGGDGGFSEVSGKRSLAFNGRVDLRAPAGAAGTLLLDPTNMVISHSHETDTLPTDGEFSGSGDTSYVNDVHLSGQLELGNVLVTTYNDGASATGLLTLDADANVQWSTGNRLTLWADNGISLKGKVNALPGAAPGTLQLHAESGSIVQEAGSVLRIGNLLAEASQGDVLMDQPNQVGVLAGYSAATGSQFTFRNAEALTIDTIDGYGVNSDWDRLGTTSVRTDSGPLVVRATTGGGAVTLQAAGNLEVQGGAGVEAREGKLLLTAGADVKVGTEVAYCSPWLSGTGGVEITAAGLVDFGSSTQVWGYRSPVVITSTGGSILGSVNVDTGGSKAGSITLAAAMGSVSFDRLNASGGSYSAPRAGNVTITAQGDVQGGGIAASGPAWNSTAAAADGGTVDVRSAAGNIELGWLSADGGAGNASVRAGNGGTILLTALGTAAGAGNIRVSGDVCAEGGTVDSSYGVLKAGGKGGQVTWQASRDIVLGDVESSQKLSVRGGEGTSSYSVGSGPGGLGGGVNLSSLLGSIVLHGSVEAQGGNGQGAGGGGTVQLSAQGSVSVEQIAAYAGGWSSGSVQGGSGGTVGVESATGDLSIGYVDTYGAQGGPVTLRALQGNILANSIYANGSYSAGGLGAGGPITLEALGTAPGRGNIQVDGYLESQGGWSPDGTGGPGGTIIVHADKNIAIDGTIYAYGGSSGASAAPARGGMGGTVDIISEHGSIFLDGSVDASGAWGDTVGGGAGGAIHLKALGTGVGAGGITVAGDLEAPGGGGWMADGGPGGSITVEGSRTVQLRDVSAEGGYTYASIGSAAGGAGGRVFLSSLNSDVTVDGEVAVQGGSGRGGGAGGSLQVQAGGAVRIERIAADGGAGQQASSAGGKGGSVQVQAGGDIEVGADGFSVAGGDGDDGPGGDGGSATLASSGGSVTVPNGLDAYGGGGSAGGQGGTVEITAAADIVAPEIDAAGGWSESSTGGGRGGNGGQVKLRFGGSFAMSGIHVDGADGEDGAAGHVDGGRGGDGGTIDVARLAAGTYTPRGLTLEAAGGWGGDADEGSAGVGGAAGAGGRITLGSQGGALVLQNDPDSGLPNSLFAGAGFGGINGDGASQAAAGPGGEVEVFATGDLTLDALSLAPDAGIEAEAGGALALGMPIFTLGLPVTLEGTSLVLRGAIDTTGSMGSFALASASVASLAPGADVTIAADQLDLRSTVNAGAAHVIVRPLDPARATRLAGTDIDSVLHLSQAEIDRITAGTLRVGDASQDGAIALAAPLTLDAARAPALGLVTQGAITQAAGATLAAQDFYAYGGSVALADVSASTLAGRGLTGGFAVASQGSGALAIGTVDGVSGVSAAGPVRITAAGSLQLVDGVFGSASGDAVVLAAPSLVADSTASLQAPAGRWLVYLDSHAGNDFGQLRSGNHALWGRSFEADPPGTVAEAGNRYLFRNRPALDVFADPASKVYDGTPTFASLPFHASGFVDAAAFQHAFLQDDESIFTGTLALLDAGKNVGSYAIVQGTLASGYGTRSFTGNTATITRKPITLAGVSASKVYDATTTASLAGDARFAGMVSDDELVYSGGSGTYDDKNVGTGKTVTVTDIQLAGADLGNYDIGLPATVSGTITPATVTLAGVKASDKVYDATTAATWSGGTLAGVIAGDSLGFGAGAASFADRHVGTDKPVTVAGWTLTGADAGNYLLVAPSALAASITPAQLTLSGVRAEDKVYDGSTAATWRGGTLAGVIAGDSVGFGAGAASFADRNVGTDKPVTVAGWTLTGADAGDYVLVAPSTLAASITPAQLTLTGVRADDKVYDGTRAATWRGGTLAGLVAGDSVGFRANAANFADRNVGADKPVTVAGWTLTGADAANYVLVAPSALAASITPAQLTLTGVQADDKVYDGTTAATWRGGTLAGLVAGDSVGFGAGAASFADRNAGVAKPVTVAGWTLSGADAGNYVLVAPSALSADITPAPLTLQADNLNKLEGTLLTFTGTEFSPKTTGIGTETITSVTLASAGAAAGASPGAYAITASGATGSNGFLAGNYAITYLNGALAVFAAKPEVPREQQAAVVQAQNQVVTFATLFLEEAKTQPTIETRPDDRKRKKDEEERAGGDVVMCKP